MVSSIWHLPAHSALPEPQLVFGGGKQDHHPLRGLNAHGPFSTILGFPRQIRLAYFAPRALMPRLHGLARELTGTATPIEGKNYYIRYNGFASIFRIPLVFAPDKLRYEAPEDCLALADKRNGRFPWKLAQVDKDEAYIGISYAIKKTADGQEYTTCCSQVFDPDGTGFEFVAYDTREFTTDRKGNPYLTYQEMQAVLSKSLLLYQNGHTGRIPRKVFVHKSSHFTDDETQGALDAFGGRTEVELIQVIRHSNWYGLKIDAPRGTEQKPAPAGYTVDRCLYLPMSPNECLLWTQGSVMGVNVERSGQPVFKEAPLKPLADPVLLRRYSGQGGWHDSCSSVLGLTKVDWNNNTLYKTMPVTLVYSQLFADVVKQVPQIVDDVYDYRLFM